MDLTYPEAGSTTLRDLVPRVMTERAQRYLALPPGPVGSLRGAAHDASRSARAKHAATLGAALMAPTCSAMLAAAVRGRPGASDELDLLVLWQLAADSALEHPVVAPRPTRGWPTLPLLPQGVVADVAPDVASMKLADSAATPHLDASSADTRASCSASAPASVPGLSVAPGYVPIVDGVVLALVDNNPLTSVRLHPEREGNTLDLAGRDAEVWVARLREAFAIVAEYLPELYEEMRWLLRVIVPVGFDAERHASCSYEDAIGAIYLTLHPSALKLAEALVHEYQHNKLHAVLRLDPLLQNSRGVLHPSPVRPDARPLEGVLLAVHAFLPVDRMYRAITAAGHPWAKSRDWDETCAVAEAVHREGATTLHAHGKPTKLGRALFEEMRRLAANG